MFARNRVKISHDIDVIVEENLEDVLSSEVAAGRRLIRQLLEEEKWKERNTKNKELEKLRKGL